MSTRSLICKENPDHTYTGIYCHWDGYPDHNGCVLVNNYTDRQKVEELLKLGDLSVLEPNLAPPPDKVHTFDEPLSDVCVAYHRDRGEDYNPPSPITLKYYKESWCEYMYVFGLDGKWRYFDVVTDDKQPLKEFTEDWADGYYTKETPSNTGGNNITFDDILNGVSNFADGSGERGVCPCCGNQNLEYGVPEKDNAGVLYPWKCNKCGATGKETYELRFSGHYHK